MILRRRKPFVCVRCGQVITRGQEIGVLRLLRWNRYHETCAEEEGLIDRDEFGRPLLGPRKTDGAG